MKAAERKAMADLWSLAVVEARQAEANARASRKRADALAARFMLDKWPKRGLVVPAGLIVVESQQQSPSWRAICEAYVSPELIAEELAALPSIPRLVLVASQSS